MADYGVGCPAKPLSTGLTLCGALLTSQLLLILRSVNSSIPVTPRLHVAMLLTML